MTRLLAVDTSTGWGGVALVEHRDRPVVVAEVGLGVRDSHSVHLVRLIAALLDLSGWTRSSIDAYAAVRGPGSFTGIRVGLGTVTGLRLATGRPAVGIGTLAAMAEAFGPAPGDRVPMLDAGRGEVYGARYDPVESPPREIESPWLGEPSRAVRGGSRASVLFGSGAEVHREALRRAGMTSPPGGVPTSVCGAAGRLAALRIEAGAADGEGMSPHYLRPADAEVRSGRAGGP